MQLTPAHVPELVLDGISCKVTFGGERVYLSPSEFLILQALLECPGVPLSRGKLRERLYGADKEVLGNPVEVHVNHLRAKLGRGLIRTLRGVGYVIPKPRDPRFAPL